MEVDLEELEAAAAATAAADGAVVSPWPQQLPHPMEPEPETLLSAMAGGEGRVGAVSTTGAGPPPPEAEEEEEEPSSSRAGGGGAKRFEAGARRSGGSGGSSGGSPAHAVRLCPDGGACCW
jgi:hypothetical protein